MFTTILHLFIDLLELLLLHLASGLIQQNLDIACNFSIAVPHAHHPAESPELTAVFPAVPSLIGDTPPEAGLSHFVFRSFGISERVKMILAPSLSRTSSRLHPRLSLAPGFQLVLMPLRLKIGRA